MIAGPIGNSLDGHGEERALSQSCLHLLAKKKLVVVWLAASPLYFNLFFRKINRPSCCQKKPTAHQCVVCVCVDVRFCHFFYSSSLLQLVQSLFYAWKEK